MTIKKPTKELDELLAPAGLKETLEELKKRGDVSNYRIRETTTTIKISPTADLASLFQEATTIKSDGRPEVWKRNGFKN